MEIHKTIGFKFGAILRLKRRLMDLELKAQGLSRTEWQAMVWLNIFGPCPQKDLLTHMEIDAGHLARTLERLEQKKLVQRKVSESDRRILLVNLTAYAKEELMPLIEKAIHKETTVMLKGLNKEEETLLTQLLKRVEENLLSALH